MNSSAPTLQQCQVVNFKFPRACPRVRIGRTVLLKTVLPQLSRTCKWKLLLRPRARNWKVSSRVLVYTMMLIISLTVLRWDNKGSSCVSMPGGGGVRYQ